MMKGLVLTVALAGATLALVTSGAPGQTTREAPLRAGTYAVDPTRTRIDFSLLRLGFAYYSGTFADPSGTLRLAPLNPLETTLAVTMPIASLSTGSPAVDGDLKGAGWFDAAHFPTATFRSTGVIATGPDRAEITGTLTLHGVTQTETLIVHYGSAGINPVTNAYEVGFEAATTVKRSDFGLTAFLPIIGDDVRLTITGVFVARR
jgi:polyisoprenoid-binding protein YceI